MHKTDERLRREILDELAWNSRLGDSTIDITVRNGIVSLTGAVDSYGKKHAAAEAAHHVLGVTDVANDLEVRLPDQRHTDAEIAQAVRHALEWNVMLRHSCIRSTVSKGWVTLEGSVEILREREDAEAAVRPLVGVRGVLNRILVAPSTIDADDVSRMIDNVLARRAHREAGGINVHVAHGTVTLTGHVRSWAEKQALLGAISHARGIHSVQDRIEIAPDA